LYPYNKVGGLSIPIEKLTWFRRRIAGIGKRIYHWKQKKVNLFSFNSMSRNVIRIYGEINNGDYKQGLLDWSAQLEDVAKNVIIEMINEPILFGLSMDSVSPKDIKDLPFLIGLIFWALLGKDYKDIWPIPYYIKHENGVINFVVRQNSCLHCVAEDVLTQKDIGDLHLCNLTASVMKGIFQALQDYLGTEYHITKEITQCFMKGDEYGEIIFIYTPK
jgi:hypothetical protein